MAQKKRRARPKPKKPAEVGLKPHRIVGTLMGARYNEHGEMIGEEPMAEVNIFAPNFKHVERDVQQAVAQARKAEQQPGS